jgi:pilus assembly protein CpaB
MEEHMKGTLITILMIGGAAGAGIAAAYFANDYIEQSVASRRAELDAQYTPAKVVVAANDLRPGMFLSNQTVAVREVPRAFLHAEAIPADRWDTVAGRVLARPLRSGEPVLMAHLAQDLGAGFSSQLEEGMRALTFPVDEESSIAGMLAPSDRIDIFFTTTNGNETVTLPLLSNVLVIATGVRTVTNENHLKNSQGQYRTVTVSVTPENAAKITLAQDAGKITIALRQPEDTADVRMTRISKNTLLYGDRSVDRAVTRRRIEIILGGI